MRLKIICLIGEFREMKRSKNIKLRLGIFVLLAIVGILAINYNFAEMKKEEQKKAKEYRTYIENKDKERALKEEEIKKDEPIKVKLNEVKDLISLGTEENYKKAITICDELIKNNDKEYRAYTLRGLSYAYISAVVSNNKNKALEDIETALKINSDYMYGRYIKGVILDNFGDYESALKWYDKSLELEKYPWSYYNKALIYSKKGNKEIAIKNLKEAINIKPELKDKAKKEISFKDINLEELK